MRELAAHSVGQLQSRKVSDVEVIASSKITTEHLATFHGSFLMTNYEWSKKGNVDEDEDEKKEDDDEEVDERTKRKTKNMDSFNICHEEDTVQNKDYQFKVACAAATNFARDLANTRGSEATPDWMEEKIREMLVPFHWTDSVRDLRVIKGNQLVAKGMNLFHNVGKGATSEPRAIIVHYQGNPEHTDIDMALIGKGVTFDTGGLNLKPTGYMEDMYGDKNGACAVLGALHGCLSTLVPKNIIFAVGLAENAIDSKSYKPGDILTSMKGLTVEIGNTDAEGRLVLADTMTYVQREFRPKQMIELSTLTGAVKIALGDETAGLFSNNDNLSQNLLASGERTFEPLWRLPITKEHRDSMKGNQSDLCNKGKTPYGGSSQAAAFLERFVEKDVEWAHLDIAGPAMAKAAKPPMCANGTGFGVSLLMDYIRNHSCNKQ